MIDLPRDLAPWRAHLDLFPRDLAEGLGRLVPRLALVVGPMRIARPTSDGDPDGFTGIARRGSYERLLLTEWLLADELPDEFIRRAAGGEHAFFQLARRSPARATSSVAFFDAGPDQLGAPRLAHLAALIVLAARAERAGARFAWGTLQRPDEPLLTEVTKQSVSRLLAARSALPPSAEDVAKHADRARAAGWEDAWIVGAQTIWPGWPRASLEVRDILDPARRALALTARVPDAPPREVDLDLPPAPIAARLLRDPFAVAVPAPAPAPRGAGVAPISNLVFAANGSKVLARASSGEIIAYPVPNSPNAPAGRPKRYRPRCGGVVAAVGWVARGLVMLVVKEREIILEHTIRDAPPFLRRTVPLSPDRKPAPSPIAGPLSPLAYLDRSEAEVSFVDAHGALFRIRRNRIRNEDREGSVEVERLADEVCALAVMGGRFAFVVRSRPHEEDSGPLTIPPRPSRAFHLVMRDFQDLVPRAVPLEGDGTMEARFGIVEGEGLATDLVAVQQRGERWSIYHEGRAIDDLLVPDGARVVGPWRRERPSAPRLVVLESDQRTLTIVGQGERYSLPRAADPIVDVVISQARAQLAFVTASGEVSLRSLRDEAPLATFPPGAGR
ncbi:Hypothetical protein A7982_09614 [Minicystis rosea]|nr:Hypothetical protein A7982_09614 [Minicystis rosea]